MTHDTLAARDRHGLAAGLAVCALAMLALLASHPAEPAGSFADLLRAEARDQVRDGFVHGGFIVVLGALIVCLMALARRLEAARATVTAALVSFSIGSGMLMASMILDGFATPAIAAHFVAADTADSLAMAKALLLLLGTLIRFLMPMGILFQAVAMAGFSWTLARGRGGRRAVGLFGLLAALGVALALASVPARLVSHVVLGGILLQALWYGALAVLLWRGELLTPTVA
jgi:hypothetical protein